MSAFNPEISARALMPKDLLGQASALHLALHLSADFVEASLSEAAGGDFHWSGIFPVESGPADLMNSVNFILERNWNERVFRKCSISFDTVEFSLVPKAFFSPDKAADILAFQTEVHSPHVDHIEIPELDAVLIFGLPEWVQPICRKYLNARIYPIAALALRHTLGYAVAAGDVMGIYVCGSCLNLVVFRDKKLFLLNAFHIAGDEDVLYHVSNAAMRLGIDFENASLHVATDVRSETLLNLFRHYNRNTTHIFANESSSNISFLSYLHSLCG